MYFCSVFPCRQGFPFDNPIITKIFAKQANKNGQNPWLNLTEATEIIGIFGHFRKFLKIGQIRTFQKCFQNRPSTLRGQDKQLFVFFEWVLAWYEGRLVYDVVYPFDGCCLYGRCLYRRFSKFPCIIPLVSAIKKILVIFDRVLNFNYFWKVFLLSSFGKIFGKFCESFGHFIFGNVSTVGIPVR